MTMEPRQHLQYQPLRAPYAHYRRQAPWPENQTFQENQMFRRRNGSCTPSARVTRRRKNLGSSMRSQDLGMLHIWRNDTNMMFTLELNFGAIEEMIPPLLGQVSILLWPWNRSLRRKNDSGGSLQGPVWGSWPQLRRRAVAIAKHRKHLKSTILDHFLVQKPSISREENMLEEIPEEIYCPPSGRSPLRPLMRISSHSNMMKILLWTVQRTGNSTLASESGGLRDAKGCWIKDFSRNIGFASNMVAKWNLLNSFPRVQLEHIRMEENCCVDWLEKLGTKLNGNFVLFENCPTALAHFLRKT
ncbi:hypothetical protein ACH5RR_037773 [Cinchona calisaya]|uniref:Uncharacterized protein n=1 Tax=Cinchona calisaya TaxID=153742 RepID=A0ABD2Y744_9GENT